MRRLEAVVRGYVQGVGYRAFAAREARSLGLTGTVRNEPDGSVRVVAEGEEAALRDFMGRLERGPSEAEVSHVDVQWSSSAGKFPSFRILL
jgi:acylphosphatase